MPAARRERLVEQALELIVQCEMAPPDGDGHGNGKDDIGTDNGGQPGSASAARLALEQWAGQSAEHEAAAREARRRWDLLGSVAPDLDTHFQAPAARQRADEQRRRQRRKMVLSVAALLGTGAIAGRGAFWYWERPFFTASYDTGTAQTLQVLLADGAQGLPGSTLDMAPRSAIAVALHRGRRSVRMERGEVRFDISPDARRPFEVLTRGARIEVVGTVFTVRDRGGQITVGVEHGHVRVRLLQPQSAGQDAGAQPPPPTGPAIDLLPGQALDIQDGRAGVVRHADTAALSAWRDGWLVFDNARLGDALATINAYRTHPITSLDPRIDAMRLTGRFRADDSAGLVAVLPAILPLTARTRADSGVELSPR